MIDFLCIGAQKSGTTLLYEQLGNIDEVCLPKVKELHFFDNDENYFKGIEYYLENFASCENGKMKGEVTPAYLFFEKVPKRIYDAFGENGTKFIVILRNPVDRAYSQYNMSRYLQKHEVYEFEQALIYENYRLSEYSDFINFSYLKRGFYAEQIQRYFKYFKRERFKFILFEEFVENQEFYINEILKFIRGKGTFYKIREKKVFSREYSEMKPETRRVLEEIYKDEILLLENILEMDLSRWRSV